MKIQSDSFCIVPWIQLAIDVNGTLKPCCYYKQTPEHEYGKISEDNLNEVWNCQKIKDLRKALLIGEKHPGCEYCYDIEKYSESRRQVMNKNWILNNPESEDNILDNTLSDGTYLKNDLEFFDFRFSNICNFSCRMCQPIYSTEKMKKFEVDIPENNNIENIEEWFDNNKQYLQNLKVIYLAGGEPFLHKQHYQLVHWLIKNNLDPMFYYQTNGSILKYGKEDIFELWKHFTKIKVSISIDGFGEVGEYIRTGYTDDVVIPNIEKIKKEVGEENIVLHYTVQACNIYFITEFLQECIDRNLAPVDQIIFNQLIDPVELEWTKLPKPILDEAIQKILDSDVYKKYPEKFEEFIKKYDTVVVDKRQEFINYIKNVDNVYDGIRITDYFPQLEKYMGY